MWIPHFGYALWEEDGVNCQKSESNKTEREFLVSFFLEDTDKREVNDSDIILKTLEAKELTVFSRGNPEKLPILFEPNLKGRVKAIRCKVQAKNKLEALSVAYNPVARTLSFWSFAEDSSTSVWALAVTDEKYKANWVAKPQTRQPFSLAFPRGLSFNKKFNAIFSLYREGRSNRSPYYRFFCFVKILEGFYAQGEMFREANEVLKTHGEIPNKVRKELKISKDQLVYALAYPQHKELENKKYSSFWVWIRDNYRHLVGHAFPDKYTEDKWLDLDDFKLFTDFAIIGNIVELIVKDLIDKELELWQNMIDKNYIEMPDQE